LAGHSGAQGLRSWIEREFSTEVPHVLETARFGYGVVFIDDVHCLTDYGESESSSKLSMQSSVNRTDELLRGLFDGFPIFGVQRKVTVRSSASFGYHMGSDDGAFSPNVGTPPILHKETYSDLRIQLNSTDDYMLQRMSIVSASSGHYTEQTSQPWLRKLAASYSIISLPTFTTSDLNIALMTGAMICLSNAAKDLSLIELLQSEIADLSRITLNTCLRMISSSDLILTTPLERVVRTITLLDISLVSQFCLSLCYGSVHIKNPGGVLQLFSHEWKRFFLDPLPQGAQRDRVIGHIEEYLDNLDEKTWAISREWLNDIKDELRASSDRVWTNASIFKQRAPLGIVSDKENVSAGGNELYLPVSVDPIATELFIKSGTWNGQTKSYEDEHTISDLIGHSEINTIDMKDSLNDTEIKSILFPSAVTLLLRMVRILSVTGKHLLVVGYPGSTKRSALLLAAKICQFDTRLFTAKESQSAADSCSDQALQAFNFKSFLKSSVLRSAGFSEPITLDDYENSISDMMNASHGMLYAGQVYYDQVKEEKLAIVIDEIEQLKAEDKRRLLHIIDYDDPTSLFDDAEILGQLSRNLRIILCF
jgi:hypothetical protein